MMKQQRMALSACALAIVGFAAAPAAHAGYLSGITGQGYAVNLLDGLDADNDDMIDMGKMLTDAQKDYIDKIQMVFGLAMDDDDGALARAKIMKRHVCDAIDQVKRQNATIGACLEDLKKKGLICIAFDAPATTAGTAINDGKPECNENDKININGRYLRNIDRYTTGDAAGSPRPYDTSFMCLVLTLLHEGKHAVQDYNPPTLGLDDCKARATKNKRRVCNEASDGMNGEDKGAHVIENEWIAELKTELNKLKMNMPNDPDASDATKNILMAFTNDFPNQKERNMAIDRFIAHLCEVERSNNTIIACYRKAKEAFDVFITTNYKTPEEKAATLRVLRETLRDARWRRIISRFDLPRITLMSQGDQPVVEQFTDDNGDFPLDTGLGGGVADILLPFGENTPWLLVLGSDDADNALLQGYFDANGDGLFALTEQMFQTPPLPGLSTDLVFVNAIPVGGLLFIIDWESGMIWPLQDSNNDEVPDQLLPNPVHQIQADLSFIQDFYLDPLLLTVWGTDDIAHDRVAFGYDDPLLGLPAENFDGDPTNNFEFDQILYNTVLYPPLPVELPLSPGQLSLPVAGYHIDSFFDIVYRIESIDPATNLPIETLGMGPITTRDPIDAPLARPLKEGEWIRISDDAGMHSPLFPVGPTCLGAGADLNGDGAVNGADLAELLANWGSSNPCADLNGDGLVNGADLATLLANWTG